MNLGCLNLIKSDYILLVCERLLLRGMGTTPGLCLEYTGQVEIGLN